MLYVYIGWAIVVRLGRVCVCWRGLLVALEHVHLPHRDLHNTHVTRVYAYTEPISTLKVLVEVELKVATPNQGIFFRNQLLQDDSKTIAACGIKVRGSSRVCSYVYATTVRCTEPPFRSICVSYWLPACTLSCVILSTMHLGSGDPVFPSLSRAAHKSLPLDKGSSILDRPPVA